MSEEYAMTPDVQARYESRMKELSTRIVENKTMMFRLKSDGTVERRTVPVADPDPSYYQNGWVDSAAKCASPEIYKLALEYPDRRAGQLRRMIADKDRGFAEDIARAVAASDDRGALEARYNELYGRSPHSSMKMATLKDKVAEGEAREAAQP